MTVSEMREFYSHFPNPSCVNVDAIDTFQRTNQLNDLSNVSMHESQSQQNHKCSRWIYDYDLLFGYRSMTSELNWVCDRNWMSITGQSAYFIGSVIGTLVLGILADSIGRLRVLIIAHIFGIVGNFLTIFTANVYTFAIFRMISGVATDNNFVMMYILVLEYIAPKMRTFGLNLCIGIFYCLGSVITPWLAVWLGNWKLYLLATIIPALIVPSFYIFIPESAEWLISKNKINDALVCYQKIAKFNRRELDENFAEDFKEMVKEINTKRTANNENPSLISLFRTPRLRRLTLILFFKS
jgi:MFS transporter, OCT family, solute carrier family 22 (organic cation transporter), member 4/5